MTDAPLAKATELPSGDCRTLKATSAEDYEPCAHYMPEVWGDGSRDSVRQKLVEPPQGTGVLGKELWFVTKFTADQYPELVSYHGLWGEENREKLASLFKRPTTWKEYCDLVSEDNCAVADNVAQRAPVTQIEGERMFVEDLYTGHFRYTEKNNCTSSPTTCTGHIANYPCGEYPSACAGCVCCMTCFSFHF